MKPNKIYISGKITGTDDYMQRFEQAEKELHELYPEASVINPAKVNAALPKDTTYEQYMEMSFTMLEMCDAIYFMKGWEESNGAVREAAKASELGIKSLYQSRAKKRDDKGMENLAKDMAYIICQMASKPVSCNECSGRFGGCLTIPKMKILVENGYGKMLKVGGVDEKE